MRELTDEQYTRRVERYYELVFRERMSGILRKWKVALEAEGFTVSGPHDLSCDDYRWYINVAGSDKEEESVDISIEFTESLSYEGSTEGASFGLDIVSYEGHMIGGLTPYNYTPQCWVPVTRPRALVERLELIEGADVQDGVAMVKEFYAVPA